MRRRFLLAALAGAWTAPLAAQRSAADAAIERAVAQFDAADIEGGAATLQSLLASLPAADRAARARALVWFGAARWWLGETDTARAVFRAAVDADAFVVADGSRLHSEVMTAWRDARLASSAIGIRAEADVTVRPDSAPWLLTIAVGRPGRLRVRLQGAGLDSTIATTTVDSARQLAIGLLDGGGAPLGTGTWRLVVERAEGDTASRAVTLTVARLPLDTAAPAAPLAPGEFRLETRRGGVSMAGVARGLLLGGAALVMPMAIAGSDAPNATVQRGAAALGLSIALGSIIGGVSGRPTISIDENVQYNRELRAAWEARNRTIALTNERARRFPPLRLRTEVVP